MRRVEGRNRYFDEMWSETGEPRSSYRLLRGTMDELADGVLEVRHRLAQQLFLRQGITYLLYDTETSVERTLPFDLIPRIIDAAEWTTLERGLIQRVYALNEFLKDIYGDQKIIADRIISREDVYSAPGYCLAMQGIQVPQRVHTVLSGVDVIRDQMGGYRVLEDNLRVPSGISYVFKNRTMMKRVFPEGFQSYHVTPLEPFLQRMAEAFAFCSPRKSAHPTVVLLTPGMYNSAYYDHSFLAQSLGIELVEGRDLTVVDRVVYMRTTDGLRRVDVIYRRIDDDWLDPLAFEKDSLIGVPGLFDAYRAGNVGLVNPWGNGVADDKWIYAFVPEFIRYYLGEEPILDNVETYLLGRKADREYVFSHLEQMVVKPTHASGGYGIVFGVQATKSERALLQERIMADPRGFIAQPLIHLSRHPALCEGGMRPCPIDLRPFVVFGEEPRVLSGGLTRVALDKDSLVVNSSQGGGVKDTWIVQEWGEYERAESSGGIDLLDGALS